jgi:membrane protein implicated in regulation of membrane protease activity
MMIYLWIFVAIASIIIEVITLGDLICIWFAVGALVSGILAWLKATTAIQFITFFVVSIGVMLIVRPLASKYLRGNVVATNSDRLIGMTATITKDITPESWGERTVAGMTWSCISIDNQPVKKDTSVRIMAIDGVKLIVKPLDE